MTHKRVETEGERDRDRERDREMMMNLKTTYIVHVNKKLLLFIHPKTSKKQQQQNIYKKYLRIMRFDLQASCNS